ncbi:hypothetical protein RB195_013093 [Necator americanus]|uniref:Uncharacterized protein n=1 Tax=Necator americanus TaxID=51031 RepID=A0ABR1DU61_NECAM
MWASLRPRMEIRVDGQPIDLVDEFCYLCCMPKKNGSYKKDIQQRCTKAISAFNSSTRSLWRTFITNVVKPRVCLSAIPPIMVYGSETWAASSTMMKRLDRTERRLLGWLLGYIWPRVSHSKNLCAEVVVCSGRHMQERAELFSKTGHYGEDEGSRVSR